MFNDDYENEASANAEDSAKKYFQDQNSGLGNAYAQNGTTANTSSFGSSDAMANSPTSNPTTYGNDNGVAAGAEMTGTDFNDASNASEDAVPDLAADAAGDTVEEAAKTAAEKGSAAAGETAAAAATGPVGAAIETAKAIFSKTTSEVSSVGDMGTTDDDYGIKFSKGIIVFLVLFIVFATNMLKMTPGSNENYKETSYSYNLIESFRAIIEKNFAKSTLESYDSSDPLASGADAYINGIDPNSGLKNALNDAIEEQCYTLIKDMSKISFARLLGLRYDFDRSLETFYANKWPYDLQTGNGDYPCIGNVMYNKASKYGYTEYTPTYDDVNFAEMLSVFSQNPDYNWETCKYEDFNEYIRTDEAKNLYYELDIKWQVVYVGEKEVDDGQGGTTTIDVELERSYDSESEVESSPKTVTSGGITYSRDKYYCDVTVKPFGLRELYLMADVDAYDDHIDYYSHSNLEMLDHQEYYERLFLRSSVAIVGPSYDEPRNSLSTIFSDLEAEYGTGNATGRSAWYYIKDPYNLKDLDLSNVQPVELVGVDLDQLRDFLNNLPDGANVLDLLQYYINQGWFPNSYRGLSGGTIKQSGCCDTTYMMIYQFMTGTKLTSAEIEQISRTYVDASGNFQTNKFLSDHGLTSTSGNLAFSPTGIINEINNSRPVVLHIRGQWTYNGTTYHGTSNGHFLTIIGYDDKGFYVADPGSSSNTNNGPIPYEAFGNVSDLYYRTIGKSGT